MSDPAADAEGADGALPLDPAQDPDLQPSKLTFPVVGIGASAGGVQALISLFEHMPPRMSMAFVVVMHLSPVHESHAASILQRATRMKVEEVTEGVAIEADHVYVIPPGRALWINDGRLQVRDEQRVAGRNTTIDTFFRALAHVHRQHAVAVVLSGTGTDGAVGLTRIKELGGVTIAQAADEAEYPGMPQAAAATGLVDFVLPTNRMPAKLLQLAANAGAMKLPADAPPDLDTQSPSSREEERRTESALGEIMRVLRTRTQHDFRHYKRPTVLRRLERRMQVTALPSLSAYRDYLIAHPEETPALLQDMLISVTNFFRDRDAFEALERDVLPALQPPPGGEQGLRVWVVGCASGEEAYSVAMLLHELRERGTPMPPFQVFASDIDERALAVARSGLYPGSIVTDVAPARMRAFFVREGEHFRVIKGLRERVLFAQHNVLRDPPFSRVDLILCRNLLIYLDRTAQEQVLETFRFALRAGGVLFLGSSESADVAGDAFVAVDKRYRLYRVAQPGLAGHALTPAMPAPSTPLAGTRGVSASLRQAPYAELHQRARLAAASPSVLVDASYKILHLSSGMSRWLQVQSGALSSHLLDYVRPELRLDLRTAPFRSRPASSDANAAPVTVDTDCGSGRVRITVQPLRDAAENLDLLLVMFDELPGEAAPRPHPASEPADDDMRQQLEDEVRRLQQHLQQVVEHAEASTEELKSSNEELQAVNEELRSASEELETSREELQSTNEELTTVNTQLALKVEEAGRVNDDLQNFINANDIATVFVDRGMRIKRFTPRAAALFNLIPTDVGRSLLDITHRLDYPELVQDAHAAFHALRLVEREVNGGNGQIFVARMLPYRTAEDKIEGAILSFVDVTAQRLSQQEARAGAERLRLAAETTRDFAILTMDDNGIVTGWNQGATRLFGYEEGEILGQGIALIFTDEDRAVDMPARELAQAREHGRAEDERWHQRKDGSVFFCSGVTTRLEGGRGFAKIARDLTGSQQAALARERLLSREQAGRRQAEATMETKELFLAVMSHELKHPLNLIHINAELLARMPEIRHVPAARRAAEIIRQTVAGQARIIDDLLDLSRARTGKLRLDRVAIDWTPLVRRIVDAMRPDAQAKGVHLNHEPGAQPLVSLFDPLRAEQVVWNLLSNALKFTPEGGSVRVALALDGDDARLTVTDSGRGIDPAFLDQVFEMFSQEGPPRRQEDGLGIGLALVRELVQAHGGRVRARSEGLGRGAEFTVWVPQHHGEAPQLAEADQPSVLKGLRLLVVDDSADSAESFAMLLRLSGAEVLTAGSGAQALELLASERFDLLISDISMPGMSGHELVQALRQQPGGDRLMALACSGYSRAQDERRAMEAGFDALIPKPAGLEQVERAVAALQARR